MVYSINVKYRTCNWNATQLIQLSYHLFLPGSRLRVFSPGGVLFLAAQERYPFADAFTDELGYLGQLANTENNNQDDNYKDYFQWTWWPHNHTLPCPEPELKASTNRIREINEGLYFRS